MYFLAASAFPHFMLRRWLGNWVGRCLPCLGLETAFCSPFLSWTFHISFCREFDSVSDGPGGGVFGNFENFAFFFYVADAGVNIGGEEGG